MPVAAKKQSDSMVMEEAQDKLDRLREKQQWIDSEIRRLREEAQGVESRIADKTEDSVSESDFNYSPDDRLKDRQELRDCQDKIESIEEDSRALASLIDEQLKSVKVCEVGTFIEKVEGFSEEALKKYREFRDAVNKSLGCLQELENLDQQYRTWWATIRNRIQGLDVPVELSARMEAVQFPIALHHLQNSAERVISHAEPIRDKDCLQGRALIEAEAGE